VQYLDMADHPKTKPTEVPNVNLEKVSGGQPGFINISRHMCVGDQIVGKYSDGVEVTSANGEQTLRNVIYGGKNYQYACGYYHPKIEKQYYVNYQNNTMTETLVSTPGKPAGGILYDSEFRKACSDCSSGSMSPSTVCSPYTMGNPSGNIYVEYIERKTNYPYTMEFDSRYVMIPNGKIGCNGVAQSNAPQLRAGALIFKHPNMQSDELKYFGVPFDRRTGVPSVSAGEIININWSIQGDISGNVAVAFFKGDLSNLIAGDKLVASNIHTYKPLETNLIKHSRSALSHYTFISANNDNHKDEGDQGCSCSNVKIKIPQAPFWDDDTVMVLILSGNTTGRDRNNNDCQSVGYTPQEFGGKGFTWFNGPFRPNNLGDTRGTHHLNEKISYSIQQYTDTFFGCSQVRDLDWQLNSNGTKSGGDQLWEVPESGSHIMKLVPQDYYTRECSDRISTVSANQQDYVVYAANCKENIGDPLDQASTIDPTNPRKGLESISGKHNIQKCMSYSMNVNPVDTHIDMSRCCSPKISGPFLLETTKTGYNESIYDVPFAKDSPAGSKPDLSLFHDNFRYQLRNRMDCECDASNCDLNACYGCTSRNKAEYDICLATDKCKANSCCIDPCVDEDEIPCSPIYEECILSPLCAAKGCCSLCNDCLIETTDDYTACLNKTGRFTNSTCKERGCCKMPCGLCSSDYKTCKQNKGCVDSGCCVVGCDECVTDNILEYFSCIKNTNIFAITKYKQDYESFCCKNTCCLTDCENDANLGLTYNQCIGNADCLTNKCHLVKTNPNYSTTGLLTSNVITWGAGNDTDGNGSGVATNSDSGSTGGTYKGIIMKTPGGVNFAPLLPNYSPCCGNTPWCNGRCEPIMFRGSDVTDAELINIFGIPSGKVSYVKVAPAVNTEMKIKLQGAVDQNTETSYFKWNTTTGVTNNVSFVELGKTNETSDNRQSVDTSYTFNMPAVGNKEVLVFSFTDHSGSHNCTITLDLSCSTSCPTDTVDQYITCLQNSGCHNLSSTTNKCCNFPCGDVNTSNSCTKNIYTLRTIAGEQRYIETYEECKAILPSCDTSGCCALFFPQSCTGT